MTAVVRWTRTFFLAGLVTCIAGAAVPARAALVAYEGFSYSASELAGQGGAVDGWSGTWSTPTATSLSTDTASLAYPSGVVLSTTGLRVDDSGGFAAERLLGFSFDSSEEGNVAYMSVLIRKTQQTGSSFGYIQLNDSSTFSTSSTGNEALYMGMGSGNTFNLGGFHATPSYVGGGQLDETYLLVGKIITHAASNDELFMMVYELGDVTTDLFDTTVGLEPLTDADWTNVNRSRNWSVAFDRIQLFGGSGGIYEFDEIRIGTTWADVTSVVPEPSTLVAVLTGLFSLAIAAAWRRRRAA